MKRSNIPKLEGMRDLKLNAKNQMVEHNIKAIIEMIVQETHYPLKELARLGNVTPGTISGWMKNNKAMASAVDKMLINLNKEITSGKEYVEICNEEMDRTKSSIDNFSKLQSHIEGIKKLGFKVTLTPIYD